MGVAEEARVERDVEEQRDRTSERDTEKGICKEEDKEEREKSAVRERGRTCNERRDGAQEEKERKRRRKKERRIYLQLPCEMLIGSLSSGKPAPAICSSVK